MQKRKPKSDRS